MIDAVTITGKTMNSVAAVIVGAILMALITPTGLQAQAPAGGGRAALPSDQLDDRLPAEQAALAEALTRRHMPELVEALLAGRPGHDRIYVARAYVEAGAASDDPDLRRGFFETAAREYRNLVALARSPGWANGVRRRFDAASWQVEYGDLLLRRLAAGPLNQFEATCGLDYDRAQLASLLSDARGAYEAARPRVEELLIGLRTEERRYLLLGLAQRVTRLAERRDLNAAWASLYLGMIAPPDSLQREARLAEARSGFDAVSRVSRHSDHRYNALVGVGIALREMGRFGESEAALLRVDRSTAPAGLILRSRHERARCYLAERRFDAARDLADALIADAGGADGDDGAVFYRELAPLLRAYVDLVEAGSDRVTAARRPALLESAVRRLETVEAKGGPWKQIARAYRALISPEGRNPATMTDVELSAWADRLMRSSRFSEAIDVLSQLADRSNGPERTANLYRLGVCFMETGNLRRAAETFDAVALAGAPADDPDDTKRAEAAAVAAFECRRRVAIESRTTDDYRRLARTARHLAGRYPDHPGADDAAYAAGVAWQEAGDWSEAADALSRVPAASPHYWSARRRFIQCEQRRFEQTTTISPMLRQRNANELADMWRALAEALETAQVNDENAKRVANEPDRGADRFRSWAREARVSAAALYADPNVRRFDEALALLADLPRSQDVLLVRLRCLRGAGRVADAMTELASFLDAPGADDPMQTLLRIADELQSDVRRLRKEGHAADAKRAAAGGVPVLRQFLDWMDGRSRTAREASAVRLALARLLRDAGMSGEARDVFDELMAANPGDGEIIRESALLEEDLAEHGSDPANARRRAASRWAQLLDDASLRDRRPQRYWEARYHWLRLQLAEGRAAEVRRGIEAERAWYPELGGSPWRERLLDLLEQARRKADQAGSP